METPRYRYPGTKPFDIQDKDIFHGRRMDVSKLYQLLKLKKMLVMYAKSGVGKSSLINAGLIPEFHRKFDEEKFIPLRIRFGVKDSRSSNHRDELVKQIMNEIDLYKDRLSTFKLPMLAEDLDMDLWYRIKLFERNGFNMLIIFDQAEEMFTYTSEQLHYLKQEIYSIYTSDIPEHLDQKLSNEAGEMGIRAGATGNVITGVNLTSLDKELEFLYKPLAAKILFVIREDKLGYFNVLSDYFPDILKDTYKLMPLSETLAREAIKLPAEAPGTFASQPFAFEKAAIDKLLTNIKEDDDTYDPFSIQLNCRYIEQNLVINEGRLIINETEIAEKGLIEKEFYENIWKLFPNKGEKEILESKKIIEQKLVDFGKERRVRVYESSLLSNDMMQVLIGEGLIRQDPTEGTYYELSHDRLIKPLIESYKKTQAREQFISQLEEAGKLYNRELEKLVTELNAGKAEINQLRRLIEERLLSSGKRDGLPYDKVFTLYPLVREQSLDTLIDDKLLSVQPDGERLLQIDNDSLIASIIKALQLRKAEEEKIRKQEEVKLKGRIKWTVAAVAALAIASIFFGLYFEKEGSIKMAAKQASEEAYRRNPTLGYIIARDALDERNNADLKALLKRESSRKQVAYITNLFSVPDEVFGVYLTANRKQVIVVTSGQIHYFNKNGLIEKSVVLNGKVISSVYNNGSGYVILDKSSHYLDMFSPGMLEVRGFDGELISTYHHGRPSRVAISSDARLLIADNCLFKKGRQEKILEFDFSQYKDVRDIIFTRDGSKIIAGFSSGYIIVFDTLGNVIREYLPSRNDAAVISLAVTDNSDFIISCNEDHTVRFLKFGEANHTGAKDFASSHAVARDARFIESRNPDNSILTSKGHQFILSSSQDNKALLVTLFADTLAVLKGHSDDISFVDFSEDASEIITSSKQGRIFIWQLKSANQLRNKNQLAKFSPFEYRLYMPDTYIKGSYDIKDTRRNYTSLIEITINYTSSLLQKGLDMEDEFNIANLDTSIKEVNYLYERILTNGKFKDLSAANKKLLYSHYANFLYHIHHLPHTSDDKIDADKSEILEWKIKALLVDTMDVVEALDIAEEYKYLILHFGDSIKDYGTATSYSNIRTDLLEAFYSKHPKDSLLLYELVSSYAGLSWYQLFNKRYPSAISAARKGLSFNLKDDFINVNLMSNLALGYLFNGNSIEAESIYFRYPRKYRKYKDLFLQDLKTMEDGSLISLNQHPDVKKEFEKIKSFLK
jgi:WD40 repeat protein